jgi:hypothetical protein
MREEKLDLNRAFEEFVVPPAQNIRERYTFRLDKKEEPGKWPTTTVIVEQHNEDGTVEDIYTYERNYAMYRTFEPFRQLKDGVWHDYALISPRYVSFEVLDLEKREVIAKLPAPTVTEEHHERWRKMGYEKWCEEMPLGTEKPGWGFCPVEFYVPDNAEHHTKDAPYIVSSVESKDYLYSEDDLMAFTGQFALYSGCVWGDDSGGWKLRYIDLSRISEGIVTEDERFGYIPVAAKSLKEIDFWGEDDRIVVPVEVMMNLKTGKSFTVDAHWVDED